MKTVSLYQEFDVSVFEADHWEFEPHKHNFFELIFIAHGTGTHILNENAYNYQKGSLFLLTPEDFHTFEIKEKTFFCIITFNKIYFSKESTSIDQKIDFSQFFKKLELIFCNLNYLNKNPNWNKEEQDFIESLIKQLLLEQNEKSFFYSIIIQNIVFLLLSIVARNIQKNLSADFKNKNPKSEIGDIIVYIQQNIYNKEKLQTQQIASTFNRSKNYISQYFKNETGQSLKEYMVKYKINLVKSRVIYSNLTILQIANELEYTDESHLNKMFKLFFGKTANQYRKDYYKKTIE